MILTLKNVRCHTDCTIDLGSKGITLIQGSSGRGKTTLFVAIYFCLFGEGNKVLNDKNGYVQLDFTHSNKEYKCIRTKKTRITLYVDDAVYEDDPAQAIINQIFSEKFEVAGYIQQNMIKSFIVMSPTEKLEFLEKFAFNGANIIEIKERMRVEIKQRNENLIRITTELDTYKKMFAELYANKIPQEIPFIVGKEVQKENRENKEYLIRKKVMKFEKEALKINSAITECKNEIESLRLLNSVMIEKERFVFNLKDKLISLEKQLETCSVDTNKLESDEQLLKLLIAQRESEFLESRIKDDRKRLDDMKDTEIFEHNQKISNIKDILWKDYSKIECDDILKENVELLNDCNEIKRIQTDIRKIGTIASTNFEEELNAKKEELKRTRLLLQTIGVYKCPKCSTSLKLNEVASCLIEVVAEQRRNGVASIEANFSISTDFVHQVKTKEQIEKDIKKLEKEIENIQISMNKDIENRSKIASLNIELSKYDLSYLEQYDTIVENIEEIKKI
jgi:DNA repair exonuclease SbcCD ATPase subunit